jgi:hypothetical protein
VTPNSVSILLAVGFCGFWFLASHAGQDFVEGVFRRHLFAAAFVLAIFVFTTAGAASSFEHFVAGHGNNGMVRGAFTAGTMIVNVIAQSHISLLLLDILN